MGASCCSGSKNGHAGAKESANRKSDCNGDGNGGQGRLKRSATTYHTVPFDVIVPNRPGNESAIVSNVGSSAVGGRHGNSTLGNEPMASFAAFDQTMYSMRADTSFSLQNPQATSTANFDCNLSFTNNFTDVNKDAVETFLKNVKTIADNGDRTRNMLEESVAVKSGGNSSSLADGSPLTTIVGANQDVMTQEDQDYINDGATLRERLERLSEVEEVLRQNIFGTWRMNSTLVQLAVARVVPTLRQRRQQWNKQGSTPPMVSDGTSQQQQQQSGGFVPREQRPVVIVHAQGLDLERSSAESSSPHHGGDPCTDAHMDGNSSASPPAHGHYGGATVKAGATAAPRDPLSRSMSRGGVDLNSATVEHYEMLALTCRDIDVNHKCKHTVVQHTWDFLSDEKNVNFLNEGGCVFRFMCEPLPRLDKETLDTMNLFINLSSFSDELKENNTPKVDVYNTEEQTKYIGLGVKAMYMLPGVKLSNITPEIISSKAYQMECQPRTNKLEDSELESTFRLVVTVVKYVFSLTVMFRVSEITDPAVLFSFKAADGIVPAKAIMLERTKRDISKVDATVKVRSMLLYYPVNGGLLCNSHTFVLNTSIPKLVAKLMNTFGSQGAAQSAETAELTRKYMIEKYGDSRKA